jgi:hypothetical protein
MLEKPPTPEEFRKVSEPFEAFLHGLAICVETNVCDRQKAIDYICPSALAYSTEGCVQIIILSNMMR